MTTKWEYMYLEYDGSSDPNLKTREEIMMDMMIGSKEVKLFLPDGSLQLLTLNGGNASYKHEILKILNQLGQEGWEAIDRKSDTVKEHWTLKRQIG